jgi:hypothetical protein
VLSPVLPRSHQQFELSPLELLLEYPESSLLPYVQNLIDLVVGATQFRGASGFQLLQLRQATFQGSFVGG